MEATPVHAYLRISTNDERKFDSSDFSSSESVPSASLRPLLPICFATSPLTTSSVSHLTVVPHIDLMEPPTHSLVYISYIQGQSHASYLHHRQPEPPLFSICHQALVIALSFRLWTTGRVMSCLSRCIPMVRIFFIYIHIYSFFMSGSTS